MLSDSYNDFSESSYRELLCLAKANWSFISYADLESEGKAILWRHDVDISIHRALRLAEIEHEEGVASTFFLMLHSAFYNLLESAIARRVESILALGHAIGLHFDPSFYGDRINSKEQILDFLEREKTILENYCGVSVTAFSWHNPTVGDWFSMDDDCCAGMVNAYGASVRDRYTYVSDSNGFWRYSCLRDVLESGKDEKLHVLTHPEWWQKSPMFPRECVFRAVEGRAVAVMRQNDALLAEYGRENLAGPAGNLKFLEEIDAVQYQLCDYLWNNRMLQSLFVELYRLHERQIKRLCKAMFCKVCRVPVSDVDAFFQNDTHAVDGWRLFQIVFEVSWVEASGCSEARHKGWVEACDQLFHESVHIPSDKIEEGCIYLCGAISNIAKWGRLQKLIGCDGIANLSMLDEHGEEGIGTIGLSHSGKWEEFKMNIRGIQKA
jgi:hypothetical protein